jgi:hypothetical protein
MVVMVVLVVLVLVEVEQQQELELLDKVITLEHQLEIQTIP